MFHLPIYIRFKRVLFASAPKLCALISLFQLYFLHFDLFKACLETCLYSLIHSLILNWIHWSTFSLSFLSLSLSLSLPLSLCFSHSVPKILLRAHYGADEGKSVGSTSCSSSASTWLPSILFILLSLVTFRHFSGTHVFLHVVHENTLFWAHLLFSLHQTVCGTQNWNWRLATFTFDNKAYLFYWLYCTVEYIHA